MRGKDKFIIAAVVLALLASDVYLNFRVNELENRLDTVEDEQTLILDNMKQAVDLVKKIVTKVAK